MGRESGQLYATQLTLLSSYNSQLITMESNGHHSVTHPVPLTGPNQNCPLPSEGSVRNLSTLCAKTLLAISSHGFGTATADPYQSSAKATRNSIESQHVGKQEHVYIERGT